MRDFLIIMGGIVLAALVGGAYALWSVPRRDGKR
jgi:hypothetical protein